jgi:hypothetical protein
MPGDFFQLGNLMFQAWQSETFPFSLFGQSPGDVAGYAISLLSQAGRRIILPIWKAIEDMLAGAMLNCVAICRNKIAPLVGNEIPLVLVTDGQTQSRKVKRQLRLNVTKWGDDLDLAVHLADPMPQDVAGNIRMALEATRGGLLSNETALSKFKIISDPASEMDRMAVEAIYRQLAPIEGVKLAIQRGDVPPNVQVPGGWAMTPDGKLTPEALLQSIAKAQALIQGQPQEGAPTPPQGMPPPEMQMPMMPQGEAPAVEQLPPDMLAAMQSVGPAMPGMPPQMGAADPQALQELMQAIMGGMLPQPSGTGHATGMVNSADMNALAGQDDLVTLQKMAGRAPQVKLPGGF